MARSEAARSMARPTARSQAARSMARPTAVLLALFGFRVAASVSLLQGMAESTLQGGGVHVEQDFAPPLLVHDLRADMRALHRAGRFDAAGSGGRGGEHDTERFAEFCDPVGRPDRGVGDFEAFCCLWERLDGVRQELNSKGFELLEDIEIHYVRYPVGGFYRRHVDDFTDPLGVPKGPLQATQSMGIASAIGIPRG